MKQQLAALYLLQQKDSALDLLKRQYAALDPGRVEKPAYDAAQAAHKSIAEALSVQRAELKDLELEQKGVETKRAEYEKKLYSGKVTIPKELQAIQDEIEMLDRQRTRLEDKIISAMQMVKVTESQETQAKATLKAAKSALRARLEAYETQAGALKTEAQEVINQRNAAAKEVPPALLKRYESMRTTKNGVAIAALEDSNACSGCKMGLPSQIVKMVHLGTEMQVCQNCGRILFAPPK